MIKLKRLLLIHWQAYDFQLIEFGDITLLTGQTAVGKSTIIDALNIVMLGEKRHIYNKAANENSKRTLESYLYGSLGDDGEDGFFYLREENFTSYLVAEFENEVTSEYFCCGFVADCTSDRSSIDTQWFTIKSGMPADFFLNQEDEVPYSINELSHQNNLKTEDEKVNLIVTDKDYRRKITGLFGQIRDDYRRLLKQSVSFAPAKDIEMFLTDFVSETESPVNVEEMQKSIRRYTDFEQESEQIKRKVVKLGSIKAELEALEKLKKTELRQDYFIDKARVEDYREQERNHHNQLAQHSQEIEKNNKIITEFSRNLAGLNTQKDILRDKRDALVVLKDKYYLKNQIQTEKEQLQVVKSHTERGQEIIKSMKDFVHQLKNLPLELTAITSLIEAVGKYKEDQEIIKKFAEVNDLMGQLRNKLDDNKWSIIEQEKSIKSRLFLLSKEEEKLQGGIKTVPQQFRVFKEELQRYLRQSEIHVEVEYLSDVIDFKKGEEKWQKAIEAYLGPQRYYLFIEPKLYKKALQYYQMIQKQGEVYGVGLINIGKLETKHVTIEKNSLAYKLTTRNQHVKSYISFLLGRVMTCDDLMSLTNYPTSITAEGFLYKEFVTRKLQFENLTMSIGQSAIEKQLLDVQATINSYQTELDNLQKKLLAWKVLPDYQKKDSYSCERVTEYADGLVLKQKLAKLADLEKKLDCLDDSKLVELDEKIKVVEEELKDLNLQINSLTMESKNHQKIIREINQELIPKCLEQLMEQEKIFQTKFVNSHQYSNLENDYRNVISSLDNLNYQSFITHYEKNQKQTKNKIFEIEEKARELMSEYNQNFTENLPINLKQASMYLEEYEKFIHSDLPRFELAIKDAKEKAVYEFRYEFLGKLKSNIENLYRQVDEINDSLKNRKFGEDSYRFKIEAAHTYKEYHEMIMDEMLMDQGEWNLLSAAFESKYAQQIELLFTILAGDDLAEGNSKENRIQTFSDYKTYLAFDMLITKGDSVQRLSKTYGHKSGGETQIPLYISLLAAFSQVYRVRNSKRNNTIRLIMMDEAFNKIDGEKIKQSIQMVRNFRLQAIFSTPPEKIAEIMEEADKAIVVFRHENETILREFTSLDEFISEPYEI